MGVGGGGGEGASEVRSLAQVRLIQKPNLFTLSPGASLSDPSRAESSKQPWKPTRWQESEKQYLFFL